MGSQQKNGTYQDSEFEKDINQIKSDVRDMKDDLTVAINALNQRLYGLTNSLEKLTIRMESVVKNLHNSIPIKAVMWMFVILGITLILVIGGIEGVRTIAPLLPRILS